MSTSGGYHEYIGGYHEYIGRCSVHWRDIMIHVGEQLDKILSISIENSDVLMASPHMYSWHPPTCTHGIPPHVLMASPHMYSWHPPTCTHGIPHMYSWHPPTCTHGIPPHVLMASPHMYSWHPPTCTHGIPPMYSWHPPMYSWHPPMYSWHPPHVLMASPRCTEYTLYRVTLRALESHLEYRRKHVLRWLRRYGDQA